MDDSTRRIPTQTLSAVVGAALAGGYLDDARPAMIFHDLDRLDERLAAIHRAFPSDALHAIAIKANPLVALLRQVVDAGFGLEAASFEEVELALAAGCPPGRVVYDSPCKTRREIRRALQLGLHVNVDNLDELARIAELRTRVDVRGPVGLRVNPQVGAGSIADTSLADGRSKFGIPLGDDPANIVDAFRRHPWLTGLHVHVGSQGCEADLLVAGIQRIVELARVLDGAIGERRVTTLDIGGGLPTAYHAGDPAPTFDSYAALLRRRIPELFASGARVVTEFGRAVHAGCGFAASRVEYVKHGGETQVAVIHLGADFLLRPAYRPDQWQHDLVVLGADGRPKCAEPTGEWTVAGPLCFAGDVLARGLHLPPVQSGDLVLIRDTGAYTVGMWSRYCSRVIPAVVGFRGGNPPVFSELRRRETPTDVVRFWS
jgi:diaminopimelate decarboxylase